MVLHVFISLLGGVPLCIPYGLYSGTSLGGTTRGTLEGYPGRVLSHVIVVVGVVVGKCREKFQKTLKNHYNSIVTPKITKKYLLESSRQDLSIRTKFAHKS